MLANNIVNVINQRMKSMGISPLLPDRFFIFSPERCDGNWKTILRILGSCAFSHGLDPKPKSSTRRVSALCAIGDRDDPDCASAPNSKPSNGERSDPNNSKSPS
jgi:hypothetical protein